MSSVLIIAEAGVNHNGSVSIAKKLILAAKKSGADFVKFQTFLTELNISRTAKKAKYQIENTKTLESQFEMVKKLELSFDSFNELIRYSKEVGIGFLSTGFDRPSLDFLNKKIEYIKIPSGEITNFPYLKQITEFNQPIILSTGMANMQEIKEALAVLTSEKLTKKDITILHCNTEYPTPMEDVNLLAMQTIANECGVNVGYSDHTLGIEVPIAAVALGAKVIEKHFTLDRNLPGPDHRASLEPDELKKMVETIRNIELAISGSGKKEPSKSEKKNMSIARKSIHLKRALNKGAVIKPEDIIPLRPGTGISPMLWDSVIGKKVNKDFPQNYLLNLSDLA
ncbi:N,N'-diacetyllegionaminic acid synthase [hydrothermal vent metagenome]|uniref:N,N'-diacetyllegionaminic acid synthase n=1 Tax=hydrothermal vent metagenome TaxID=652676 RepID=A0A3B0V9F1_9ZZZZ